jgi:hypothetical protein
MFVLSRDGWCGICRSLFSAEKYHGYLKMPIPERLEATAELRAEGMTMRAPPTA